MIKSIHTENNHVGQRSVRTTARSPWTRALTTGVLTMVLGAAVLPGQSFAADSVRPKHSFVSVDFPCAVEHESVTRETPVGDILRYTASCSTDGVELSITAIELPNFIAAIAADPLLVGKARREMIKEFDADTRKWTNCDYAEVECRKFEYTAPDGRIGHAELLLQREIFVVVNAFGSNSAQVAKTFLSSIQ